MEFIMSDKKSQIFEKAISVINDRMTIAEFALGINKSYRQAQRIIKSIESNGLQSLVHGNLNKVAWNLHPCRT